MLGESETTVLFHGQENKAFPKLGSLFLQLSGCGWAVMERSPPLSSFTALLFFYQGFPCVMENTLIKRENQISWDMLVFLYYFNLLLSSFCWEWMNYKAIDQNSPKKGIPLPSEREKVRSRIILLKSDFNTEEHINVWQHPCLSYHQLDHRWKTSGKWCLEKSGSLTVYIYIYSVTMHQNMWYLSSAHHWKLWS